MAAALAESLLFKPALTCDLSSPDDAEGSVVYPELPLSSEGNAELHADRVVGNLQNYVVIAPLFAGDLPLHEKGLAVTGSINAAEYGRPIAVHG